MSVMTTAAVTADRLAGAPKLRLLASGQRSRSEQRHAGPHGKRLRRVAEAAPRRAAAEAAAEPPLASTAADAPVLVVGDDASQRSATISELGQTMQPGTTFAHASALWEVLVLAASCRMVILSGDLIDVPGPSLMRILSHRYPTLPIVALDGAPLQGAASHASHI